jgi:4-hydroxybenzoate polyprenyltransferase
MAACGGLRLSERWSCPLVVELDGTLSKADSIAEGIVAMLLRRPSDFFGILSALAKGRRAVAEHLTRLGYVDAEALPIRRDFLDYLERERANGRELHLAASAMQSVADAVAARLGIFGSARGSENGVELRGDAKLQHLQQRFPDGFSYAGGGDDDIPVWRGASSIVIVGASPATHRAAERLGPAIEREFPAPRRSLRDWIRALRLHQWSKNLLLFVPLLLAHKYNDLAAFQQVVAGFIALGCVASGTYLINDLSDLRADRAHPTKRFRLVARGDLGAMPALLLALALIVGGLIGGAAVGLAFGGLLVLYVAMTLAYSLHLKTVPIFDAFVLGSLYTLRVLMGSVLIHVTNSPWLLSFTMFSFFSLSMAKRHLEIVRAPATGRAGGKIAGRGYVESDAPLTLSFGVSSSLCAILILFFYVTNDAYSTNLYAHPRWLWLIAVWVFLWFARIWLLTHRGELNDDPVLFAVRDPWSYVLGLLIAGTFVMAVL